MAPSVNGDPGNERVSRIWKGSHFRASLAAARHARDPHTDHLASRVPMVRDEPMKEILAVVKPFLAERVLEALKLAPLEACTVREVKGFGRQKSYLDQYGDSEYSLAFLPKVEIQLFVDDARVDEVVERIVAAARTGRMGDGKIFVLPAVAAGDV